MILFNDTLIIALNNGQVILQNYKNLNMEEITEKQEKSKEGKKTESKEESFEEDDQSSKIKLSFRAHDKRVKKILVIEGEKERFLLTISTNGEIKIWDLMTLVETLSGLEKS